MPIRERRKLSSCATSAGEAWKRPPPCSRCRWRPSRETGVWLGVGCYCKSEARIALASPPNPDASYAFAGMPPGGRNRNLRRPSRSLGPRRATEVFRGDHIARHSQSADELAGAFHGRRDLRNRPDKARRRLFRLGRDRVEFERCCLTRRRGGAEKHAENIFSGLVSELARLCRKVKTWERGDSGDHTASQRGSRWGGRLTNAARGGYRSEEHTSELQSP